MAHRIPARHRYVSSSAPTDARSAVPNDPAETFLVFRFLTGFSSSAFLSVAGGSVSDLFDNKKVAT